MKTINIIEFTKESGEVILSEKFSFELTAQKQFKKLESIKWPKKYKGLTMNLSEYYAGGGNIGTVRLVVESENKRFVKRELYRNA